MSPLIRHLIHPWSRHVWKPSRPRHEPLNLPTDRPPGVQLLSHLAIIVEVITILITSVAPRVSLVLNAGKGIICNLCADQPGRPLVALVNHRDSPPAVHN